MTNSRAKLSRVTLKAALVKSRQPRRERMASEIESHGAVHVGAVDTRSRILQPLQDFHSELADRVAEPNSAIRLKRESRPATKAQIHAKMCCTRRQVREEVKRRTTIPE